MFFSSLLSLAIVSLSAFSPVHAAATQKRALANVVTQCSKPNQVALTFDDGPFVYIYDISKALVAAGAKGTFFFNGDNYGCIYTDDNIKRVKYAYNKGHQVASHTWSHKDLATLTWDQVHDEMWRLEEALIRILGVYPAFMRPPYGSYNDNVRAASAVRGQTIVNWDLDSGDSTGLSPDASKAIYDQAISHHPSSILALNHETHETTAHQVVPYIIQKLQSAGYELVTVAECLGMEPYQWTTTPSVKDDSWHC